LKIQTDARERLSVLLAANSDYPWFKAMTELERGMEALKVDVETVQETVTKAIVSIDEDTEAPEENKIKYQDEIVKIHGEMRLPWMTEKTLIAEAHSAAVNLNTHGGMPQTLQGSREGSGQATPSLGRYKAWRGDKSCQPKLLASDIQPVEWKRWRASMEGYLGAGTETGASPGTATTR
jgi:hypothetical protein